MTKRVANCLDCGETMPWDEYDWHMNREHRPQQRIDAEPSKFEQTIGKAYLEACVASLNNTAEGALLDPSNKFAIAARAIEQAWPDIIDRVRARL